jgi:hypothetical protein
MFPSGRSYRKSISWLVDHIFSAPPVRPTRAEASRQHRSNADSPERARRGRSRLHSGHHKAERQLHHRATSVDACRSSRSVPAGAAFGLRGGCSQNGDPGATPRLAAAQLPAGACQRENPTRDGLRGDTTCLASLFVRRQLYPNEQTCPESGGEVAYGPRAA